jgi:hypothetical protein
MPAAVVVAGHVEQLAGAGVHQDDRPDEVRDDDALDHAAQDRFETLPLDAERVDRAGDVARHLGELLLEDAEVVGPLGREVGGRRPGRERPRELHEPLDPSPEPVRDDDGHREPEEERDQEPGEQEPLELGDVRGDRGERDRDADHADLRAARLPPRRVEEPVADRRAVADGAAAPGGERGLHLGAVRMVLERFRRARRLADDAAVGGDHGDARAEVVGEARRGRVERGTGAPGNHLAGGARLSEQPLRQRVDLVRFERDPEVRDRGEHDARERRQRRDQELDDEPRIRARRD